MTFTNENRRAWRGAAADARVADALRRLYDDLDQAIDQHGPVCRASGRCCRFDEFGHRLYVTGLEIARVVGQVKSQRSRVESRKGGGISLPVMDAPGTDSSAAPSSKASSISHLEHWALNAASSAGCPLQDDRLCSVHAIRPLGCRVFFCQAGTKEWQHPLYETYQEHLRRLHERFELPYGYMEWRRGLAWAVAQQADEGGRSARASDG